MKVYRALTRPKLKRGAEWKLTAVNGLFTILLVVTALVSHLWWTLGVAALFYWPGQWLLRQAAKHDPQWLAVYTRSLSHPLNRTGNTLTLRNGNGESIEMSPARWKGVQVYNWEQRTLAVGDRLQFRIHDKKHKVANGEFATITELDRKQVKLRFDDKRELALPFAQLRHADYGYASTSHAAQGATVDRVIVNADSMRNAQLVNRKQFYVSISRARHDAQVYTDDFQALRRAVAREPRKAVALETVKPARPTTELQQQQTSLSIKI